jgi:hypothetical protein
MRRRMGLVVVGGVAIIALGGLLAWQLRSSPTQQSSAHASGEPKAAPQARPSPALAANEQPAEPGDLAHDPQARERAARAIEAKAAAEEEDPNDGLTPPELAAIVDDALDHLRDAARPCVARAKQKLDPTSGVRFQYTLVVQGQNGSTDGVRVMETDLKDAAVLDCIVKAIETARWRSSGDDRRTDVDTMILVRELGS